MIKVNQKKWIISIILVAAILLSGLGGFRSEAASAEWVKTSKGWMYVYPDQTYAKSEWIKYKKKYYYVNKAGIALTGWKKIKGNWYYFKANGEMVRNAWVGQFFLNAQGIRTRKLKATTYTIPEYYRTQLYKTVKTVNSMSENWTSFAIITDTHGDGQRTQNVIRYLLDNSKVSKCFWLGDLCNGYFDETGKKEYIRFRKDLLPYKDQIYVTIGNHDRKANKTYNKEDAGIVYREFLKDKEGLNGCPEDFYYYFDDPNMKIRYLVLNTANVASNQRKMDPAELKWIKKTALKLPGENWNLIVLGHTDIDPNTNLPYKLRNSKKLIDMLSSGKAQVVGYFCGHEHIDAQSCVNGRFYQNALASDCIRKGQAPRKVGTIEDGAVTVVSVNTKTGRVVFNRIGLPMDGKLENYNYRKLQNGR